MASQNLLHTQLGNIHQQQASIKAESTRNPINNATTFKASWQQLPSVWDYSSYQPSHSNAHCSNMGSCWQTKVSKAKNQIWCPPLACQLLYNITSRAADPDSTPRQTLSYSSPLLSSCQPGPSEQSHISVIHTPVIAGGFTEPCRGKQIVSCLHLWPCPLIKADSIHKQNQLISPIFSPSKLRSGPSSMASWVCWITAGLVCVVSPTVGMSSAYGIWLFWLNAGRAPLSCRWHCSRLCT